MLAREPLHLLVVVDQAPVGGAARSAARTARGRPWRSARRRARSRCACERRGPATVDRVGEVVRRASFAASAAPCSTTSTKPGPPCSVTSRPRPSSSLLARGGRASTRARASGSGTSGGARSPSSRRVSAAVATAARRAGTPGRPAARRATAKPAATSRGAAVGRAGHHLRRRRPRRSATSQSPPAASSRAVTAPGGGHRHRLLRVRRGPRESLPCGAASARPRSPPSPCCREQSAPALDRAREQRSRAPRRGLPDRMTSRMPLALSVRTELRPTPPPGRSGVPNPRVYEAKRAASRRPARRGAPPPSTNSVGVVITPARMPERKSRSTRSATAGERRSGSKRSRSSPSRSRALPQVRVVEVALVRQQRVVHLPEAPLQRGRLGRRGQHRGRAGAWRPPGSGGTPAAPASAVRIRWARAQCGHSRSAYSTTSGPSPRTWSSSGAGGVRRSVLLVQRVEDQVGARDLERRWATCTTTSPSRRGRPSPARAGCAPRSSM